MNLVTFLDECLHLVCKECLSLAIKEHYPDVPCPIRGCKSKISDLEARNVLTKEEYEDL